MLLYFTLLASREGEMRGPLSFVRAALPALRSHSTYELAQRLSLTSTTTRFLRIHDLPGELSNTNSTLVQTAPTLPFSPIVVKGYKVVISSRQRATQRRQLPVVGVDVKPWPPPLPPLNGGETGRRVAHNMLSYTDMSDISCFETRSQVCQADFNKSAQRKKRLDSRSIWI